MFGAVLADLIQAGQAQINGWSHYDPDQSRSIRIQWSDEILIVPQQTHSRENGKISSEE
jgi:hypothetical protein